MNYITMAVGVFPILYGLYTLAAGYRSPEKSGKLKPMKAKFGRFAGNAVYIMAYIIMPIAFGIILIRAGVKGMSIAEFFSY